jgi:hypothetical protein
VLVVRKDGSTTTVTLTQLVRQDPDGSRRWLFTTAHPAQGTHDPDDDYDA